MPKCPLCNRVYDKESVGIRLFQSKNECVICFEHSEHMVALPCGHQFCKKDLDKIGFKIVTPNAIAHESNANRQRNNQQTIFVPIPSWRIRSIRRRGTLPVATQRTRSNLIRRRRIVQKRCGWCGLKGHRITKCKIHLRECGCRPGSRTRNHKLKFKKKRKCLTCGHKGHRRASCHKIIIIN